jgi:amino acid adenylation domain-containing protein
VERKLDKSAVQDILEISLIQKGMLYHYLKDLRENIYNVQLTLEITGNLDIGLFEEAIHTIQRRNEVLRSVFRWEEVSRPVQIILKDLPLNIDYHDFLMKDRETAVHLTDSIIEKDRKERFDLHLLPLRITVIRVAEDLLIACFTHHHILYDGWSTGIFLNEVFSSYDRIRRRMPAWPEEKPDYKRLWKAAAGKSSGLNSEEFWKSYLGGYEMTRVFSGNEGKQQEMRNFSTQEIPLPDDGMRAFAGEHKVTKAAIVYTAYGLLLQKYTNTDDIVFGTTVSVRDGETEGAETVMGNFINTLPFRLTNNDERTLTEVVVHVNAALIGRSRFFNTSYYEIKQYLQIKPSEDLFDSVVVIENYPMGGHLTDSCKELKVRLRTVYENTGIPMMITAYFGGTARIELTYDTGLISDREAARFAGYFSAVLHAILRNGDTKAGGLSLLTDAERMQMIASNRKVIPIDRKRMFPALFRAQVEKDPLRDAVEHNGRKATYQEVADAAARISGWLLSKGPGWNRRVAVFMSRGIGMLTSIAGILEAGGTYIPIDAEYPDGRIRDILADSEAAVVLTDPANIGIVKRVSATLTCPVEIICPADDASGIPDIKTSESPLVEADTLAYMIYTSGTTGKPKGVMIHHLGMINHLLAKIGDLGITGKDIIAQTASPCFDISIWQFLAALLVGGKTFIVDKSALLTPQRLAEEISYGGVTVLESVPSLMNTFLDSLPGGLENNLGRLRWMIPTGEPLSVALVKKWYARFPSVKLLNAYGPTEASDDVTHHVVGYPADGQSMISIGKPIRNMRIHIVDRNLNLCPEGVKGEICIAGPGVGKGYWNDPAKTSKVFIPNPFCIAGLLADEAVLYRTGDIGSQLENGDILCLGRSDEQVKVRGFRIELQEIADRLQRLEQVKEVVVVDRQRNGDKFLVAYYVADREIDPGVLRRRLSADLPDHMLPAYFKFLDKIPLTSNGKTDKSALPEPEPGNQPEAGLPSGETEERLLEIWSEVLGYRNFGIHENFFDIGGDSLKLIRISSRISAVFGRTVSITDLFEYPTVASLARLLDPKKEDFRRDQEAAVKERGPGSKDHRLVHRPEIAIIGMAGRFPGAANIRMFWQNLSAGTESITRNGEGESDDGLVFAKGILQDHDSFDGQFFGYTQREARWMDPQIRVFHECVWAALEDAGYCPARFEGRIGLYAGASPSPYYTVTGDNSSNDWIDKWDAYTYGDKDFLCSRISYKLNLKGPSVNVATTCSTSLVAVDVACNELLAGKCEMALAGGVSITFHDNAGYRHQKGMILSPDGRCRAFDEGAGGTVGGNGAGVVLLKRLDQALEDGDHIYAVIKSTATNNDGNQKVGFTAPGVEGQSRVIGMALDNAGVPAESIAYIEAHGTGTSLGDPIEIAGLRKAFHTEKRQFCAIGSVKTNIGHLDSASGIAGLIKAALSLHYGQIPASLHFNKANPALDLMNSPFYVNTGLRYWEKGDYPRRAGVSSFGIGGTNAHVILEEAPEQTSSLSSREFRLLLLSARTPDALRRNKEQLALHLETRTEEELSDVAYTLQIGREAFPYRSAIVCKNREEALERLAVEKGLPAEPAGSGQEPPASGQEPAVVFMFSGQGSQYENMFGDLYRKETGFRTLADEGFSLFKEVAGKDLRPVIFPGRAADRDSILNETEYAQPALFILEYALARLIMNWGVRPSMLIGHSIGEYVAACLGGVFSLEDALMLVTKRGQLMQKTPPGRMLGLSISRESLEPLLDMHPELSLAAANSPEHFVISGKEAQIGELMRDAESKGYKSRLLPSTRAFHSALMDGILGEFEEAFARVSMKAPAIPILSSLTGQQVEMASAGYWVGQIRREVKFAQGVENVLKGGRALFVELGPGNALQTFVRSCKTGAPGTHPAIGLVRHYAQAVDDQQFLMQGLAEIWRYGVPIDWKAFYEGEKRRRVPLPAYAFEKVRIPMPESVDKGVAGLAGVEGVEGVEGALTRETDISNWLYVPFWKSIPAIRQAEKLQDGGEDGGDGILVFSNGSDFCLSLADHYRRLHSSIVVVNKGPAYLERPDGDFEIDPEEEAHFDSLFTQLLNSRHAPQRVIYAWDLADISAWDLAVISARNGSHAHNGQNMLPEPVYSSIWKIIRLVKAAHRSGYLRRTELTFLTCNLQHVTGDEQTFPGVAPLLALLKVISQEYPALSVNFIDVSLKEYQEGKISAALSGELYRFENGSVIALRGSRGWRQGFERLVYKQNGACGKIKSEGIYVITGGSGELGYALAAYLLKHYRAKVVLLGRTALPVKEEWDDRIAGGPEEDETIKRLIRIRELDKSDGEVSYRSCDVACQSELATVMGSIEKEMGAINGVIYAAGIVAGRSIDRISQLEEADFETQFRSKPGGLQALRSVLNGKKIDFCLVASSLSTVLGGVRFGAYAAANMAADEYVHYLSANNETENWISVDFDGLAFDNKEGDGITTEELHAIFERLVSLCYLPQVIVSVADLDRRVRKWIGEKAEPGGMDRQVDDGYGKDIDTIEERLLSLWADFFGKPDIGDNDNFFQLGGDSLKVLTMISAIQRKLGIELSFTDLFEYSTVRELSDRIRSLHVDHSAAPDRETDIPQTMVRAEKRAYYPLSSVQRRLYFLYELDKLSIAYNMPLILTLKGDLDRGRVEEAFRTLIGRHESLRTSFEIAGDEVRQWVVNDIAFELGYDEGTEESVDRLVNAFIRPFDLRRPPLFRAGLIRTGPDGYILMVDAHHIIADGISESILIREFASLYRDQELPALAFQYKDYVEWQLSGPQRKKMASLKKFWLDEFAQIPEPLELPADFIRPPTKDHVGHSVDFEIGEEEAGAIKAMAETEGVTIFMILLSVFNILLSRLTNQEEIAIGTAVSGRQYPDLDNILGMFVNTLVLKNTVKGDPRFREFLQVVKNRSLACFDNQAYPYEELVDQLRVDRDTSRNPLFDVMFSYQGAEKGSLKIAGLAVRPYAVEQAVSKFDLTFSVVERDDRIDLNFEYATTLFRRETIDRFIAYVRNILAAVIRDREIRLSDIDLLSKEEAGRLLHEFNQTDAFYPENRTLVELFEQQVKNNPDSISMRDWQGTISYRALRDMMNDIAYHLRQVHGVAKGDLVGIMLERERYLVPYILGVLKAGGVFVPLDPHHPRERIRAISGDAGYKVVITRGRFADSLSGTGIDIIDLDKFPEMRREPEDAVALPRPEGGDPAYVIYTSGSTGRPKGVVVRHDSLVNYAYWAGRTYVGDEKATFPLFTAITFDLTLTSIFVPLITGNTIHVYREREGVLAIEEVFRENEVEVVKLTPSHLRLVRDSGWLVGPGYDSKVKCLIVGGEELTAELAGDIHRQLKGKVKIYNEYGPTEATVGCMIHLYDAEKDRGRNVPIGKPIANTRIYLLDKHLKAVPTGVAGELYIAGAGTATGYLNNPALTADRLIANPFVANERLYRTGDLARHLADGSIDYIGRIDNQVKIRGFRIETGEIEHQLLQHGAMREVTVRPWLKGGERHLVAYYVGESPAVPEAFRLFLSGKLPEYMIPAYFIRLDSMPLTSSGKINDKVLPEPVIVAEGEYKKPINETQKELVRIWAEVLQLDDRQIGIHTNFFDMGGNSLKLVSITNKINKHFGLNIPVASVFKFPVISMLAGLISERMEPLPQDTMPEIEEGLGQLAATVELLNDIPNR